MLVIKHQRIVCCLLFLMITAVTKAQITELPQGGAVSYSVPVAFMLNDSLLNVGYQDNQKAVSGLDKTFLQLLNDSNVTLNRVQVSGYSSPDGPYLLNERLAWRRANRFKTYLQDRYTQLPSGCVKVNIIAEDWDGVAAFAAHASDQLMPHRHQVVDVAKGTLPPDEKEALLRRRYPKDFQYLLQVCMPRLRRVEYTIDYLRNLPVEQPVIAAVMMKPEESLPTAAVSQKPLDVVKPEPERRYLFALRTNLLYDVVLIPNIGLELSLGKRWTIGADWFYTWFSSDNHHRYWQAYGGYLTLRRYFGRGSNLEAQSSNFTGHHLGIYGLGMTYDVEWGGRGYQAARFGFGGGVEYGYSASLSRCLKLDFTLGVGFQDGEYKEYDPIDDHYVWQSTHKRHWWGPTKAEVSLKWLLGKKGGDR